MTRLTCVWLATAIPIFWTCSSFAQITSVWLASATDRSKDASFIMPAKDDANKYALTFVSVPDFTGPDAAKIQGCKLRMVAEKKSKKPDDQDVTVAVGDGPVISAWSAAGQDVLKADIPYFIPLDGKFCTFNETLTLKLQSNSPLKDWTYYGPAAIKIANRPRLIITYDAPDAIKSAAATRFTDWKYGSLCPTGNSSCAPPGSAFFNSTLGALDGDRLTNPVSFNGQIFVVGGPNVQLYRLDRGAKTEWRLSVGTVRDSVAFVTAAGSLKVITAKNLYSCDLAKLSTAGTDLPCRDIVTKWTIDAKEAPAMGADGSVYFRGQSDDKNLNGKIVGFNPWRQEIWETDIMADKISPITLTGDGLYAYALAKISSGLTNSFSLLRVDTVTGEIVMREIEDDKHKKTTFSDTGLLRPAVLSRAGAQRGDYVFVAANTASNGTLALFSYDRAAGSLEELWAESGAVKAAPVLGAYGNELFVIQGSTLDKYNWTAGVAPNPLPKPDDPKPASLGSGGTLFFDAGNIYRPPSENNPQFWSDGAIIGYKNKTIYDISPESAAELNLRELAPGTIYSAAKITVLAQAVKKPCEVKVVATKVPCNDAVILKGNSISLNAGFHWPMGATLHVVNMPLQ